MNEKEKYFAGIPEADAPIDAEEVDLRAEVLTWYARKDTLRRIAQTLIGNFIETPGYGCTFNYTRALPWVRVERITDLRPCEHGGTLVEIRLSPR